MEKGENGGDMADLSEVCHKSKSSSQNHSKSVKADFLSV